MNTIITIRNKMKDNYEICLIGPKVILFPYRPEHVPQYHEWMKDPSLLEATGSEPLSLEEEIEMQQSWRNDPKKCTFIVHSRRGCSDDGDTDSKEEEKTGLNLMNHLDSMVGDVNLFFSDIEGEKEDEEDHHSHKINSNEIKASKSQPRPKQQAEIDIMIAEHDHKRKGLGRDATSMMLLYGASLVFADNTKIRRYFCKINDDNAPSIRLFENLGFVQCDYVECFKQFEYELKFQSTEELTSKLQSRAQYKTVSCPLIDTIGEEKNIP